jgi:hypothetical protein
VIDSPLPILKGGGGYASLYRAGTFPFSDLHHDRRLHLVCLAIRGWGFADFTNGKPGSDALHQTCFPCHQPAKDRDCVFTRYAPTP